MSESRPIFRRCREFNDLVGRLVEEQPEQFGCFDPAAFAAYASNEPHEETDLYRHTLQCEENPVGLRGYFYVRFPAFAWDQMTGEQRLRFVEMICRRIEIGPSGHSRVRPLRSGQRDSSARAKARRRTYLVPLEQPIHFAIVVRDGKPFLSITA